MRRAWLTTVAAALCVVTSSTTPVSAMPSPTEAMSSWTDTMMFWRSDSKEKPATENVSQASLPSAEVSPWRHPIKYFSAAMSETPVAAALKRDKTERTATEKNDKIALNTPTGPATPQYFIAMAQMAEQQGNIALARQQLQQGLAKWPSDVEILRTAARMEDRQGQLQLAESLYRRAVTTNPQHAGALNDLGLCLARQGKLQESAQVIEQAVQLQPDKALYRNNAATVLVEMRQDQRALAHLSAAHTPAAANFNLGKLLVDRGRSHEALMYFQTAIELDPMMQPAHAAIAQLQGPSAAPTQVAERPIVQQQPTAPAYGDRYSPQQAVSEPSFPATARGPAYDTSSHVPPGAYYPANAGPPSTPLYQAASGYQNPPGYQAAPGYQNPPAYQTMPTYQTATAPRYLPPVRPMVPGATMPGTMVR